MKGVDNFSALQMHYFASRKEKFQDISCSEEVAIFSCNDFCHLCTIVKIALEPELQMS